MKSVAAHWRVLAGSILLAASLPGAQDWKAAEVLPGVDLTALSAGQRVSALKVLREHDCSCGCGRKLAQCRIEDPNCSYSVGLSNEVISQLKVGKTENEALKAADSSRFGHRPEPKLLDDPVQIPTAGSPALGPANAPITLVEFSDFQCPYCAAAEPQLKAVLAAYPTQVKLIFKQFPLEQHPQADLAAAAALAAQKQGKFWEFHDAMYGTRDLSRPALMRLAASAGLDVKRFEQDIDSTAVRETVIRDVQDGNNAGVEGTPTLFINGQRFNGSIHIALLKPVLDAALKPAPAATPVAAAR